MAKELRVYLERRGDRLARRYGLAEYDLEVASEASLAALGESARFDGASGVDGLVALLNRGEVTALERHLTRGAQTVVGELLFRVLFGDRREWQPVLSRLFRDPPATRAPSLPIRGAVRLRICTSDPSLEGLPWRLTSWKGRRLADGHARWTFEVTTDPNVRWDIDLPAPAGVLVIAPNTGPGAVGDGPGHVELLQGSLAEVCPHYAGREFFRPVSTRSQLLKALPALTPQIVYYYGHGEVRGDQVCLLLDRADGSAEPVSCVDLRRYLADGAVPAVVYLNGCLTGTGDWHSAGHQLTPDVPVVIANRTTAWSGEAADVALRWFRYTIGEGLDPVVALHRTVNGGSTRGFAWATKTIHTAYRSFTPPNAYTIVGRPFPGHRVDRAAQRAQVFARVSELSRSRTRRVEAIVAYAAPGNLLDRFNRQLVDHVETESAERIAIKEVRLTFPTERERLGEDLAPDLLAQLQTDDADTLTQAIRLLLPRVAPGAGTPVVWLDWGVFGGAHQPALRPRDLDLWLHECVGSLGRDCPDGGRVVALLGIEAETRRHARLRDELDRLRLRYYGDRFQLFPLPPLSDIRLTDLLDFFDDPSNVPRLPRPRVLEAAKLILAAANGRYEESVALIEEGENGGWIRLLDRLRGEAPEPDDRGDEEPF